VHQRNFDFDVIDNDDYLNLSVVLNQDKLYFKSDEDYEKYHSKNNLQRKP